jgi:hypothetical protein
MREAQADLRATPAEAALAACLATVLELPVEEVPEPEPGVDLPDGWRRWLAGRGVGLVPIADAGDFSWPGPWIARIRPARDESARAVVMYGVPSGVVWDPTDAVAGRWSIQDGFVLAALDVALTAPVHPRPVAGIGLVEGLFVAPSAGATTGAVPSVRALPGHGLEGDRHVVGAGTFPSGVSGSALTLIAAEVIDSFAPPLAADEHRRNVVTRGIDVNALVGRSFTIGAVRCRGTRLCEPCTVLDGYSERRLLRPLVHRGGLRADILTEGTLAVGDQVEAVD